MDSFSQGQARQTDSRDTPIPVSHLLSCNPNAPETIFTPMGFSVSQADEIKTTQLTDIGILLKSTDPSIVQLREHIHAYNAIAQAAKLREPLISVLKGQSILAGKQLYRQGEDAPIGTIEKAVRQESVIAITLKNEPKIPIPTTYPNDFPITINGASIPLHDIRISIYKPREEFLWDWCLVNAKLTTQAALKECLESDALAFNKVTYLKLLMIMVNVMIDDMADQIQNEALLNALTTYINDTLTHLDAANLDDTKQSEDAITRILAAEKQILLTSRSVREYSGTFDDYLSFTADIWQQAIETARKSLPKSFKQLITNWKEDYSGITHAMTESLRICSYDALSFLEQNEASLFRMELSLANNMNMMGFESVDAWFYAEKYLRDETDISSFMVKRNQYKAIFLPHLQFMAQTANHLSTGVRELDDNDVSNALFLTLANTQAGSRFDLDQLRLTPPLVQHIITERITQDLSTQHTYGEVVSHWFTACTAIDQLRAANAELATTMHLDTNLQNIKTFTISYLKFIGKL